MFLNEYALRCNLVHFERPFGDIFGVEAGRFGGKASTPQIP